LSRNDGAKKFTLKMESSDGTVMHKVKALRVTKWPVTLVHHSQWVRKISAKKKKEKKEEKKTHKHTHTNPYFSVSCTRIDCRRFC
jgi:uncharacterized lipoprotein NlpE involved in copper resistance